MNVEYFQTVNENAVKTFLTSKQWPAGLQDVIVRGLKKIPIRYFICDDSGTMSDPDGNILLKTEEGYRKVGTTRWVELSHSLKFHVDLLNAANTQAEFLFLNGGSVIISPDYPENASRVHAILESGPGGATPLCANIKKVVESIQKHETILRQNDQLACVIIATDGHASDGEIAEAMKPLETLPCWVVVRLCTDEVSVVKCWSELDKDVAIGMDVLDDLFGEATEVDAKNNWFTYGEPIHRVREFGVPVPELDLLDEQSLVGPQIRTIAHAVYGGDINSYPTEIGGQAFMDFVALQQCGTSLVYDTISNSMKPWIKGVR